MKHEIEKLWAKRHKAILRAFNAQLREAGLRGKIREIAISIPEIDTARASEFAAESASSNLDDECNCVDGTKPCFFLDHNGKMRCKCIPIDSAC